MGPTWATLFQVFFPVLVLKEMVIKMFQQPPQGSEMVKGDGVDDAPEGALDYCMRESSQMVEGNGVNGDPVASLDRSPHPDAEREPCESGHDTLKPIKESQVINRHPAESLDPLSFAVSKRGKKRATAAENSERKKRKRGRKWTNGETENLIHLRLQSLRNRGNVSRLDMNESNERVWEAISKHLPERTAEECQNRWDTVVRSYKTIKSYLDGHGKEFSQASTEDFEKMKVGQYFRSAEWYKMFGEQREVWDRSHGGKGRRLANMDIGASTTTGMPALAGAEPVKSDAFPDQEVVKIASALDRSESRVGACELPVVRYPQCSLQWTMTMAIGYFLFEVFFWKSLLPGWVFPNQYCHFKV